jgi:hypothetical protein
MSKRNPDFIPTPPDLPRQARIALYDNLYELRRQNRGVRATVKGKPPITDPFQVQPDARVHREDTGYPNKVEKLHYEKGEAPAMAYVRSLGMDAKVASEVAAELGVSTNLIRKWGKDPDIPAPSYEVPYGKNKIYLYTPEDVEALRAHQAKQRTPIIRKVQ